MSKYKLNGPRRGRVARRTRRRRATGGNPFRSASGRWVRGKRAKRAGGARAALSRVSATGVALSAKREAKAAKALAGLTYFTMAEARKQGYKSRKRRSKPKAKKRRKSARRGRTQKFSGGLRLRRTKIRATVAVARKKGSRKGKLVFMVPKRYKRSFKGRKWLGRRRLMFNPVRHNPDGLVANVKDFFSLDTVKTGVVGVAGFALAAGLGEAASRAALSKGKNPSDEKAKYVLVGVVVGGLATAGGTALVARVSPTAARVFFVGGVLGTLVRAIAAAFPGNPVVGTAPTTASSADDLAMKLHAKEAAKLKTPQLPAPPPMPMPPGKRDYLEVNDYVPAVNDYLAFGGAGADRGNPMAGPGQSW